MIAVRPFLKVLALLCTVVIILIVYTARDQEFVFRPFAVTKQFKGNFTLLQAGILKPLSFKKAPSNNSVNDDIIRNIDLEDIRVKILTKVSNEEKTNVIQNNFEEKTIIEHKTAVEKKTEISRTDEIKIATKATRNNSVSKGDEILQDHNSNSDAMKGKYIKTTSLPKQASNKEESGEESADGSADGSSDDGSNDASSTVYTTIPATIGSRTEPISSGLTGEAATIHVRSITTESATDAIGQPTEPSIESKESVTTPQIKEQGVETTTFALSSGLLTDSDKPIDWMLPQHEKDEADLKCPISHNVDTFRSLLQYWVDLCDKHHISYYLTCATLLGAYRDGNAIPYDSDIDIIMDLNDVYKLKPIQSKRDFADDDKNLHLVLQVDFDKPEDERRRFKCNGELTSSHDDHCSFQEPVGRLIQNDHHLDIFHYIVKNDGVQDPSDGGRVFSMNDIFPTKRCKFMGVEMRCPNKAKTVLSAFYTSLEPYKICVDGAWEEAHVATIPITTTMTTEIFSSHDVTTASNPTAVVGNYKDVTTATNEQKVETAHISVTSIPDPTTFADQLLTSTNDAMKWMLPQGEKDEADSKCSLSHNVDTFHNLLQSWVDLCDKYNISYYITCGTLLGAYRDGNAIPYDSDIDIIMDLNDVYKLKPFQSKRDFANDDKNLHLVLQVDFDKPMDVRRRFKCNGKLTPSYADHCSFQEPLGRLVQNDYHLDLYHYIVKNETVEDPSEGGRVFNVSDIFPMKRCKFMGIEMRCPNKPKAVLSSFYSTLKPYKVCVNGDWIKNT